MSISCSPLKAGRLGTFILLQNLMPLWGQRQSAAIWKVSLISKLFILFFFFNFFFNVYSFLGQRETEHERGRGREKGRHRIRNRLQALSHQPRARRGARTHGPRDSDLAEVGRLTDCATQAPLNGKYSTKKIHLVLWPKHTHVHTWPTQAGCAEAVWMIY